MREIKFKIYNPKAIIPMSDGFHLYEHCGCNTEDLIYLQYTGLKDKNEVEIYEGDIVKVKSTNTIYQVILGRHRLKYNDYDTIGFILFNDNYFDLDFKYWPLTWGDEVVGNIWETPELLNGDK